MPCFGNDRWDYPLISEALAEVRLDPIVEYIYYRHTSVVQYINTGTILDLAVVEDRRSGYTSTMCRW